MSARTLVRLRPLRRAFTLVEMLIAMALTLILVYAIAEFYAYVGDSVKDGRAMIEMSGHLRGVAQRLRSDLEMLTCPVVPPVDDGGAPGYFEYVEGPGSDADAVIDSNTNGTPDLEEANVTTLLGDGDDILAFTIRTAGEPFVGRRYNSGNYEMIASSVAEVIWFTSYTESNGTPGWQPTEPRFLHRRLLLIRPDLAVGTPDPVHFHLHNDISANYNGTSWVANTLADLSRREKRFARQPSVNNFPNTWLLNPNDRTTLNNYTLQDDFLGEDVVLSNLLAFDVRLFDPYAPVHANDAANPTATVQPGDPGWQTALASYPIVGRGAYVDLNYDTADTTFGADGDWTSYNPANATNDDRSHFSSAPHARSGGIGRTYDTWATSYERDGYNQDGDGSTDEATDGLDEGGNMGVNGVDDATERETSPPYPHPLRGIEVKVRVYEPSTRQVRQATVAGDFLPE